MKRPHWRGLQSVRLRVTLWNVTLFALVLLVLGAVSHGVLSYNLLTDMDRQLAARASLSLSRLQRASGAGRGAAERGQRPPQGGWGQNGPSSAVVVPGGRDNQDANRPAYFYRPKLLTLEKRDYFRNTPAQPWDARAFSAAARGRTVHSTVTIKGDPVRVLSQPIRRDGRVAGVIQVAQSLSGVNDALRVSSLTLLMLVPVALLVSGVVGAFVTSRALRPVRTLREAAERIRAQDLSRRLPTSGRDEFSELARTFNDMLDRLESAFRQQARFTADASHELRTPLTVLRGNISLALSRERSAEEYRQTLERVRGVTERMGCLVEDLLLLSRADAAQLTLDAEPVPLQEVLAAAAESVPGRHISLVGLPEEGTPLTLRGNHALLVSLFTNLVRNAARHTPPEGSITLRATRYSDSVKVAVEDTGEGIPPEHLPHIHERFYRVDSARTAEGGGTGLGLAIVHSIVDAHGGTMEARSEVGKGTTITVLLPLDAAHHVSAGDSESPHAGQGSLRSEAAEAGRA